MNNCIAKNMTAANSLILQQNTVLYNPPSLASGASVVTTVAVKGAKPGFYAEASYQGDLQGVTLTAWASAFNVISVRFHNSTGATVDLPAANLRAKTMATG